MSLLNLSRRKGASPFPASSADPVTRLIAGQDPEPPQPAFAAAPVPQQIPQGLRPTAANPRIPLPQQPAGTPRAPRPGPAPGEPPVPVRCDLPMGLFSAVVTAGLHLPSPLWCARCGTDFTSDTAGNWDRMLIVMHRQAAAAGWARDPDGSLCCPECRRPRNLPVLASTGRPFEAEVALAESLAAEAGRRPIRDLDERSDRFDRIEGYRRRAAATRRNTTTRRAVAP